MIEMNSKIIRRSFCVIIVLVISLDNMCAQIPYFGTTIGKEKIYTYLSDRFHPGKNSQSVYGNIEYGILKKMDVLTEFYLGKGYDTQGWGIKYNLYKSLYANVGIHSMVNFDLHENYRLSYVASGIYINGHIYGNIGYVSNTFYTEYSGRDRDFTQWWYLYYDIKRFKPMVGFINSWSNHNLNCLALGTFYNLQPNINVYLWLSNLANQTLDTKVVLGIDVIL